MSDENQGAYGQGDTPCPARRSYLALMVTIGTTTFPIAMIPVDRDVVATPQRLRTNA